MNLFEQSPTSTAVISECGKYRYRLARTWDSEKKSACFIMLNPSTADDTQDDPTIRRCIGFAKSWGCGGIVVVNLFAFRATKPKDMMAAENPIGPKNDQYIWEAARECSPIIAAWGKGGRFKGRSREVSTMLVGGRISVQCLRCTLDGEPWHPLYVPGNVELQGFLNPDLLDAIKK